MCGAATMRLFDLAGQWRSWCQTVHSEQLIGGTPENPVHVADEAVDVSLAGRLVDDVLVVVIADAAT